MSVYEEQELNELFARARAAYPDEIEPSPEFLAGVWARIEAVRPTDWLAVIERWSPRIAFAGIAAAALMTAAVWIPEQAERHAAAVESSYLEALAADSMDEHDGAMWVLAGLKR